MDVTGYCEMEPDLAVVPHERARALSFESGYFTFDGCGSRSESLTSSGNKLVFRGVYADTAGKVPFRIPAVAVYYLSPEAHARELSNMKVAALWGVGPELLDVGYGRALPGEDGGDDAVRYPVLIEEDVGVSLKSVLQGALIPLLRPVNVGERAKRPGLSLAPAATEAGKRQTAKLLFDLYSQLSNLQRQGKCHRDLKAANICVKAFGDNPEDIRATLIDLEFGVDAQGDGATVSSERYYRVLFEQQPALRNHAPIAPAPLQQDMGYLSLVVAEIEQRTSIQDLPARAVDAALGTSGGFFGYEADGSVRARKVCQADLDFQAARARLTPVGEMRSVSLRAVELAERATKHGGYLDALDKERLERNPDMVLEKENDRIARRIFENYVAHRVRDGQLVEYATFDDQPDDLKESCRDQVRGMRDKMEALDFDIVPAGECPDDCRVDALSDWQVEHLSKLEHDRWVAERTRAGWTYAPGAKDVEARTSPYLLPWDELDEAIKEYDRDPMREMIGILNAVGLVVRRRA